jgi:hypothetical protein
MGLKLEENPQPEVVVNIIRVNKERAEKEKASADARKQKIQATSSQKSDTTQAVSQKLDDILG